VEAVVQAGLACIPAESLYYKCIHDVIQWYHEHPDDWRAVWQKIEDKWQDDIDCVPGHAFNIDAKLNGAYIVMGLLYGRFQPCVDRIATATPRMPRAFWAA